MTPLDGTVCRPEIVGPTAAIRGKIRQASSRNSRQPFRLLFLLAQGKTQPETAEELGTTTETVKYDLQQLMNATRCRNSVELISLCCVSGLLPRVPLRSGSMERLVLRHREILELQSMGCTYQETARALSVTANTAKTHARRLMSDLDARTIQQAVALYRQRVNNRPGQLSISCQGCMETQYFPAGKLHVYLRESGWTWTGRWPHCPKCAAVKLHRALAGTRPAARTTWRRAAQNPAQAKGQQPGNPGAPATRVGWT